MLSVRVVWLLSCFSLRPTNEHFSLFMGNYFCSSDFYWYVRPPPYTAWYSSHGPRGYLDARPPGVVCRVRLVGGVCQPRQPAYVGLEGRELFLDVWSRDHCSLPLGRTSQRSLSRTRCRPASGPPGRRPTWGGWGRRPRTPSICQSSSPLGLDGADGRSSANQLMLWSGNKNISDPGQKKIFLRENIRNSPANLPLLSYTWSIKLSAKKQNKKLDMLWLWCGVTGMDNLHKNREYKSLQSQQEWKCRCWSGTHLFIQTLYFYS